MKEKILQALKTKYTGVQALVLDRVADELAKTVTDEATIETAVGGVGGLITTFNSILQSEGDRRATEASKTAVGNYEKQHNLKEGKPIEAPKPADPNDVATIVANAVKAAVEPLQNEINQFKQKGSTEALTGKLKAKMAEKKIPEAFLKGRTIESEEKLDSVLSEIEADFTDVKQNLINEGVVVEPPKGSVGNPSSVDADIEAWAGKKSN